MKFNFARFGWLLERSNRTSMSDFPLLLLIAGIALFTASGCTPGSTAGEDNSAAVRSAGTITDDDNDYHPPRSPAFDDMMKGR
jgi:hypothetical protein